MRFAPLPAALNLPGMDKTRPQALVVHPDKPICNGEHFDEAGRLPPSIRNELIYRGMVFGTIFTASNGSRYAGTVIAKGWDHAEACAEARGLGEMVDGQVQAMAEV